MENNIQTQVSWLDRPVFSLPKINWETTLFLILMIAAVFTRFYDLDSRVMSHDETSHTYFSWLLETGKGYAHDPITHGPFQFHIVALSYFLFGDSDTSARIPAVLFGIATIGFTWFYRRYLGRLGALIAGVMILISPYALFYARYVRNEAFIGLYLLLTIWAILRYLETGQKHFMYLLTLATVMHYISKETSFIYSAILLLFIGFYFLYQITSKSWNNPSSMVKFIGLLIIAFIFFGSALGYHQLVEKPNAAKAALSIGTSTSATAAASETPQPSTSPLVFGLVGVSGLAVIASFYFLLEGYGVDTLRHERSFSIMLLQFILAAPMLTPFIINFLGWKIPVNANEVSNLTVNDIGKMLAIVGPTILLTILVGLWWNKREYAINASIFWSIFIIFYTTFFTNGAGIATGMVGSLGYWLAQQAVNRGSQPVYYYALLQLPVYEFLALAGVALAIIVRVLQATSSRFQRPEFDQFHETKQHEVQLPAEVEDENAIEDSVEFASQTPIIETPPVFALLAFWSFASLAAFSVAGEKMPWLTYHIALPMILLSSWGLGLIVSTTDWMALVKKNTWLVLGLMVVFIASLGGAISSWGTSSTLPFVGKSLQELSVTTAFMLSLLAALLSAGFLAYLLREWSIGQIARVFILTVVAFLAVLQARAAFRASYINYDSAQEYLVYAHSGPAIKVALKQIEDISKRTTGSLDMVVAYDNETTYPYWWYLRNYTNQRYFGSQPTREQLRDAPVILVGEANYAKVDAIVGQAYDKFDYIRIWWPNQDYFDLTWERVRNAVTNPAMRSAIFQIWLNRDYREYAKLTKNDNMSASTWSPSARFRLYVRKDISAKIWNFGTSAAQQPLTQDPYEGKGITLAADQVIGAAGNQAQFNRPRGIAVAPDGSLYVADSGNHRIQHLDTNGNLLQAWGSFADISKGPAPGGTFFEPWSVAVGPDGYVYVADTWNHRIQKFTSDGTFVKMWGTFGQAETPEAFWGPRTVVIDAEYRLYVMDTGNKRVVVFDKDGNYITQFGTAGSLAGQFDEPVGLAIDNNGSAYVADTWNQRIQKLQPAAGGIFNPLKEWAINGWFGQSLDNKPYIVIGPQQHLFVSDPEGYRILEFDQNGTFIRFWGDLGISNDRFNLPTGLAYDNKDGLWVADAGNNRVMHFKVP